MRPAGNIEKIIKNVDMDTSADRDKAVLADVLKVLEESKKKKRAAIELNIWRTIMKSRITRLAAAAAILTVVLAIAYNVREQRVQESAELAKGDDGIDDKEKAILKVIESGEHLSAPELEPELHDTTGFPTTAQSIAYSDVIVRAKLLEMDDVSKWEVVKVIHGQSPPAKVIDVISPDTEDDSSWRDRHGRLGVERIMFLRALRSGRYAPHLVTGYDGLDDKEEAIMKVIESGEHLTAPELEDELVDKL